MMCISAIQVRPAELRQRAAFTIIELLTVMAIILILAGLVLGIAGHAQGKAAQSRAQAEIQAISAAANNYQIDNGTYPRVTVAVGMNKTTDKLDPRDSPDSQVNYDPAYGGTTDPNYSTTSLILYELLSGLFTMNTSNGTFTVWKAGAVDSTGAPIPQPTKYYPFTDSQLKNPSGVTSGYIDPTTVTAVIDPYGFSYGYSTIYQADVEANALSNPTAPAPPANGYNPTYDLWSTAGYSPTSGKAYPTVGGMTSSTYNTLWVKNW